MFAVLSKWLQGQHVVWPVVISSIASTLFNIICNYAFAVSSKHPSLKTYYMYSVGLLRVLDVFAGKSFGPFVHSIPT